MSMIGQETDDTQAQIPRPQDSLLSCSDEARRINRSVNDNPHSHHFQHLLRGGFRNISAPFSCEGRAPRPDRESRVPTARAPARAPLKSDLSIAKRLQTSIAKISLEKFPASNSVVDAQACSRLYHNPELWKRLRENAFSRVARECSPELQAEEIKLSPVGFEQSSLVFLITRN